MKFSVAFALLILVPRNVLGKHLNFRDDLTLDDLQQTNVTCAFSETCQEESTDRKCSCKSDCGEFGDCCIDSPFRNDSTPMVECRNTALTFSKKGYFLVSRCPPQNSNSDSPWRDLCEKGWNGEDDMMMLAPVSSLDTFVTYKNYYCFRCHEDDSDFRSWDIRISSHFVDKSRVSEDFSIAYDKEKRGWTATTGDDYVLEDIHFNFTAPPGFAAQPDVCNFVLVSDCVDSWEDEETRGKCRSYTAVVYSMSDDSVSFRNPHCALCNFVPAEDIFCGSDFTISGSFGPKKVFSFAHLLDIGRDDETKTKKCEENQLWDPYGRKCRRIACAIPGYVVKEGRCTPP